MSRNCIGRVYSNKQIIFALEFVKWSHNNETGLDHESWLQEMAQSWDIIANVKRNFDFYCRQFALSNMSLLPIGYTEAQLLQNMAHYADLAGLTVKLSYALVCLYGVTKKVGYLLDAVQIRLKMAAPLPDDICVEVRSISVLLTELRDYQKRFSDTEQKAAIRASITALENRRDECRVLASSQLPIKEYDVLLQFAPPPQYDSRSQLPSSQPDYYDAFPEAMRAEEWEAAMVGPQQSLEQGNAPQPPEYDFQSELLQPDYYDAFLEAMQAQAWGAQSLEQGNASQPPEYDFQSAQLPSSQQPVRHFRHEPYDPVNSQRFVSPPRDPVNSHHFFSPPPRKLPEAPTSIDDTELSFEGV